MPYLIQIGTSNVNDSGTTSKGYCIWREGTTVHIEYGAIEMLGGRGGQPYWQGQGLPDERPRKFDSVSEAEEFKQRQIRGKLSHGYCRLGHGRIIKSHRLRPR
jgi:hypothetical protein